MATEATAPLQIDPGVVGRLDLPGFAVPYVDLEGEPFVHTRLRLGETEYRFDRSFPIKGHSAVMPAAVAELQAAGRQILVAERSERYYVYVA